MKYSEKSRWWRRALECFGNARNFSFGLSQFHFDTQNVEFQLVCLTNFVHVDAIQRVFLGVFSTGFIEEWYLFSRVFPGVTVGQRVI